MRWVALAALALAVLGLSATLWRRWRARLAGARGDFVLPAPRVQRVLVALRIEPASAAWLAPWLRTQGAPGELLPARAGAVLARLGEALAASTHGALCTGRRAARGASVRCEGAVMTQVLLVGVVFSQPEALALEQLSRAALGAWLARQSAREEGAFSALWVEWTLAEAAHGSVALTRWEEPGAPVVASGGTRAAG